MVSLIISNFLSFSLSVVAGRPGVNAQRLSRKVSRCPGVQAKDLLSDKRLPYILYFRIIINDNDYFLLFFFIILKSR